jgi:CHAT domain-containing protein/Tfp pilus assembly protein PilF
MKAHATKRDTRLRAGEADALSRLATRFALLCAISVFSLPIFCLSQTESPPRIEREGDLIAAIVQAGKDDQAINRLLDAYPAFVTPRLWETLNARALFTFFRNDSHQSLALYGIALIVGERLKDGRRIANTHYNIGKTYSSIGKTDAAIQSYLAGKTAFENAGLRRDLIYILSDLSSLYFHASDYKQARSYAEQSLALAERLKGGSDPAGAWPDDYGVAGAWSILGALSRYEGDYAQAIEQLGKAIAIYQQLDHGGSQFGFVLADNITELSRVYGALGDHVQALGLLNQALAIAKRLPQREILANVLNSIGVLYLEQEDYEKATEHLRQSLQIYQAIGNKAESARVLLNFGVTEQRRGNFDLALEHFRQSLALATADSNKDGMIAAAKGLGIVLREKNDYVAALENLDRSLALAKEIGDQVRIAEILWRKAQVQQAIGNFAEAAALSESALQLARQLQLPKLSYLTATTLGAAYLNQQKTGLAFQTFSVAIERLEAMRDQVVGEEQGRQLFFENHVAAYHSLVALLVSQGKSFDALLYAEQAKGRVLLDVISGGRINVANSMTSEQREEDQRLRKRIVTLNNEIREARLKQAPDQSRINSLTAQLDSARLQHASFQDVLYASHPELRKRLGRTPVLSQDALNALARNGRTAFLEYVVTKDRTYLFVVTKTPDSQTPDLKVFSLNVVATEQTKSVDRFRRILDGRLPAFAAPARELYARLIKPAEALLRGKDTICVVPDGILWDVPFQALQSGDGRFLLEDYAVHYAPSLSVLDQMMKQTGEKSLPAPPSLLAFANPATGDETIAQLREAKRAGRFEPLPYAESEVKAMAQIFGPEQSKVFIGSQADEKTFKSLASGYGAIHFSTHSVLDNRHPLYSYLLMAKVGGDGEEDGLLEAREIMDLNLHADLVVLSACETARGKIGAGEGVIGMSWAFFVAGCRTTVVSQWKVSSDSTAELLVNFFRHLKASTPQGKMSKAVALRSAALKLMKDDRYRHPFYWAGFVIIGHNE